MKHDLEAINAAIALGDRPIPPDGSMIQIELIASQEGRAGSPWIIPLSKKKVVGIVELWNPQGLLIIYQDSGRHATVSFEYLRCIGYRVLGLPCHPTVPFSEWPRDAK